MPETTAGSENRPLVVLIHGAWHGAWCWTSLQSELDRRGIASLAIDLPGHGASTLALGDLHGDAAHVVEVVTRHERPVVLVGHSYGGAVITEAAFRLGEGDSLGDTRPSVTHLVYLAAFCPDTGETVMELARHNSGGPVDLGRAIIPIDGGLSVLDPFKAAPALYGDCDQLIASAAVQRLGPQPSATMLQPISGTPPRNIPRTYVVCTHDRSVHPGQQEYMARRCDHVVRFETGHSPFLSMTRETADVITGVLQ